jgi:hypothetical protein
MWRGLQSGYPDPPQKIFEQPETPVKKDPHVARLTSGQARSLLSFSFMISWRDFGRGAALPRGRDHALEGSFPGVQLGIPLSVVTSVRRALGPATEIPMPILDEITQPDPAGMGGRC